MTPYQLNIENDKSETRSGLDDNAFKDFNDFMSGIIIPGLLLIADKHNYDRDDFIKYTSTIMSTMAEVATFANYKYSDESEV